MRTAVYLVGEGVGDAELVDVVVAFTVVVAVNVGVNVFVGAGVKVMVGVSEGVGVTMVRYSSRACARRSLGATSAGRAKNAS